eukprot:CAMPEP_0194774592 /NCGR_PEP_ID=MMETSP0323_2-20130528/58052_1 /TAXON_ID=2866 ORGANISM="Crypthecodinium cohnii, Strain Seligo" /NCGR_SAMPLE_ID=MMETSP0323_2 /ASSEMBLY_ACC=CAM_ASM_000346 /LENGTH=117 /DNA_ID=CAMNT_0039710191 /DNA_START=118 /DNA_END=472 /DNA_ORIENTATION=-
MPVGDKVGRAGWRKGERAWRAGEKCHKVLYGRCCWGGTDFRKSEGPEVSSGVVSKARTSRPDSRVDIAQSSPGVGEALDEDALEAFLDEVLIQALSNKHDLRDSLLVLSPGVGVCLI